MHHEHRYICSTCSREMKAGRNFTPAHPISKLSPSGPPSSGSTPGAVRGWGEWLLEWANIALKFGYLVLAFLKL